jgi:hypothetical protein
MIKKRRKHYVHELSPYNTMFSSQQSALQYFVMMNKDKNLRIVKSIRAAEILDDDSGQVLGFVQRQQVFTL